jgi:hypothetical protein
MINNIRRPIYTFIGISFLSFSLSGCILHVNAKGNGRDNASSSYSKDMTATNKSVTVGEGRTVENISSVNGSILIKNDVVANKVTNTNGQISIRDNVSVDSVKGVNGQIKIGEGFTSQDGIKNVNGQISIREGSKVGGDISTVNGSINLSSVTVEGGLETVNGSISLQQGSLVKGNIYFRGNSNGTYSGKNPTLYISSDSAVDGDIILERPVELKLQNENLNNKVKRLY